MRETIPPVCANSQRIRDNSGDALSFIRPNLSNRSLIHRMVSGNVVMLLVNRCKVG